MSDATWDIEYSLASDYYRELVGYCNNKGIDVHEVGDYPRSWELKKIIKNLKDKN